MTSSRMLMARLRSCAYQKQERELPGCYMPQQCDDVYQHLLHTRTEVILNHLIPPPAFS